MPVYRVSIPGSVMLLGEHAVLYGQRALACAIDQRIKAQLTPLSHSTIKIISDRLGVFETSIDQLQIKPPFEFVLCAIKSFMPSLTSGFILEIKSDVAHTMGLGSSAAVTVATVHLLQQWLQTSQSHSNEELFHRCLKIVHEVQNGIGSGADIAASIFGGIISIQHHPTIIEKLPIKSLPIELIYSGYKTPTPTVVKWVSENQKKYPSQMSFLFESIGKCAQRGYQELLKEDFKKLGKIFTLQQSLFKALNLSTPIIEDIINEMNQDLGIVGAKISGSGLGDCVIGLGQFKKKAIWERPQWQKQGVLYIASKMTFEGCLNATH